MNECMIINDEEINEYMNSSMNTWHECMSRKNKIPGLHM